MYITETFFLPDETRRIEWEIPSHIFNLSHTLLARSELDSVFVPIRSLQYLGVITHDEIVFVDSQAYAYSKEDKEGGRLIMVAWKIKNHSQREALNDPVPCHVVYYHEDSESIQKRLVREFTDSLHLLDQRYRDQALPASGARILKLK